MTASSEFLGPSSPDPAGMADDASRFAACCAMAACAQPARASDGDDSPGAVASAHRDDRSPARQLADFSLIVCMAAAKVRSDVAARERQIRLDLPSQPLLVHAAPSQLEAVVINLLRAALDAGATELRFTAQAHGRQIRAQLEDNRPASPTVASVLRPTPTLAAVGGESLAISIARRIVEDHGGELVAMHHALRGALVSLTLPQCDAAGAVASLD